MKSIRSVFQGERARGFTRRWVAVAALAALAVVLAAVGAPTGGAQAEVLPTGAGEYGKTPRTADARFVGVSEQRAPSADAADNRLGEAYRLQLMEDIGSGTFWLSSTRVNLTFNGHPSTDAAAKLSCSIEGSEGTSVKMPDNLEGGFVMNVLTLTPATTYQFWIECAEKSDDGAGAVRVGPTTEITTLKPDALKARNVRTEAGVHSITIRWKLPKAAFRCDPLLNNERTSATLQEITARKGEYRYENLTPGTSYVVQLRCALPYYYDSTFSDPLTVTTRELQSIAGFEATRKDDDWIRVRWDKLDGAKRYMVSFMPGAKKGTACGTGEETGAWQRTKQKTKHLQTGLQPDTRYKVCLKAIGPNDETMSHAASLFVRTKPSSE